MVNMQLGRGIQLKSDKVETKCGLRQILTIIGVYVTYVQKNVKIRTSN